MDLLNRLLVKQRLRMTDDSSPSPWYARGGFLIFLAAALWSTSGLFAKAPRLAEWSLEERGMQLAFWRALFAGLAILPFVRKVSWTWRIMPTAFWFALMNFSFLKAMTLTTAANAIWLQCTAPAWVLLIGVGWLGEKAIWRDFVMVFCAMLGVAVIVICEWRFGPDLAQNRAGVLWSLTAGVAFAGVMLGLRQVKDLSTVWVTAVCHFSASALLAPWVLTQYALPSPPLLGWMAVFGAFQLALPYLFFARGLQTITSHEASCIALLEPLLVPFWVFLCWRTSPEYRAPEVWTWVGGAVILAGLLARYWPRQISGLQRPNVGR